MEMPGHCLSLLSRIRSCHAGAAADDYVIAPYLFMSDPEPHKQPQTPYGVLCPGTGATFEILEEILAEVIGLFPSVHPSRR